MVNPSDGSFYSFTLMRNFVFIRLFCWFERKWFCNAALNKSFGSDILDIDFIASFMGYVGASHADQ